MRRAVLIAPIAAMVMGAVAPAVRAQPLTRDELETALRRRDAEIAALERRIAVLEARGGPAPSVEAAAPPAPPPPVAAAASPGRPDDEVALQALSRGLVERGALLLPTWGLEFSPSLAYAYMSPRVELRFAGPAGTRVEGLQAVLAVVPDPE